MTLLEQSLIHFLTPGFTILLNGLHFLPFPCLWALKGLDLHMCWLSSWETLHIITGNFISSAACDTFPQRMCFVLSSPDRNILQNTTEKDNHFPCLDFAGAARKSSWLKHTRCVLQIFSWKFSLVKTCEHSCWCLCTKSQQDLRETMAKILSF